MKLQIIKDDPSLAKYEHDLSQRLSHFSHIYKDIVDKCGSLRVFAQGYKHFGIHCVYENSTLVGWVYREWAPSALQLFLIGDFNGWDRNSHPLQKKANGEWEIFLAYDLYKDRFTHQSKIKVRVLTPHSDQDRIPLYATRVVQNPSSRDFSAELWLPSEDYKWQHTQFKWDPTESPRIYEAHVGMSEEHLGVASYKEFTQNTLPRVKANGYNVIQLMAIQEHPYYGSFGYHVSNFYAASSRFGTPDELKELIDTAHSMGIAIIMDLVHSHSVKNTNEGICDFDGTVHQFFHGGDKGTHWLWDSKLFDYEKRGVQHFLLSNIAYWLEEYHFDGFRFDGVTSMMYQHHGLGRGFDHYDSYFYDTDWDAIAYLQLANALIKEINPHTLSVAEDVSGMPGLCRPIHEGGIGFDYRLAMGLPDYWIKTLKEKTDEQWDVLELWGALANRRSNEKHIAYVESHDQAIVGDKTVAMWLMNADMYYWMRVWDQNYVIDRGLALHKMIRFITLLLGGEGYLNFMGNEFGHPDWIDFPREGNGWSFWYARRQWSIADNPELKYQFFGAFDKSMMALAAEKNFLNTPAHQIHMDPGNKIMIFQKHDYIFVFNWSPNASYSDYRFGVPKPGTYQIVLNSDSAQFGGYNRVDQNVPFFSQSSPMNGFDQSIQVYIPHRTALALRKI